MFCEDLQELLGYQEFRWGEAVSERWVSLCDGLRDYQAPGRSLAIEKARKWELVSAVQKSIRRGDQQIARRLISAMDSQPAEYAYFWRRLCVIACEDIGPADDTLAAFVVACSIVFPPREFVVRRDWYFVGGLAKSTTPVGRLNLTIKFDRIAQSLRGRGAWIVLSGRFRPDPKSTPQLQLQGNLCLPSRLHRIRIGP